MEELKTTAVLISVILIASLIYWIWPKTTEALSFKGCKVEYILENDGLDDDLVRTAHNKLALCLCKKYLVKKDEQVARQIMDIYQKYGGHFNDSSGTLRNIDSVVKYRSSLLDTLIMRD
ncbi:hypothetical protein [Mucilaginibacter myungsuensis]|uniref:Uncharacterized protein n=1 Tax=Mucilaginibacter myungsuensis TaxID=649104 RepID=A0A929L090_9SPHI|nr:hypothetical protein [Mucilaginibacter myungsuensis]MBE9663218.1 hypothetical protein [Mucilaginibacter myungsuensis]MDN3598851.1 hypothetical protein [Mucilaginibacter myungsuensis]